MAMLFFLGSMYKGIILLTGLCLAGCSKEPAIEVYSIPKETSKAMIPGQPPAAPQAPQQPSMAGGVNISSAEADTPSWVIAQNWKPLPLGSLKKGSWEITNNSGGSAEVSVLVFPGDVGGDFKNINRWRGQAGLKPWDKAAFDTKKQSISVGTFDGVVVVLESTESDQAIIGAIIPVGDNSWYFKMMGTRSLVLEQKEAFLAFLSSVSFPL